MIQTTGVMLMMRLARHCRSHLWSLEEACKGMKDAWVIPKGTSNQMVPRLHRPVQCLRLPSPVRPASPWHPAPQCLPGQRLP